MLRLRKSGKRKKYPALSLHLRRETKQSEKEETALKIPSHRISAHGGLTASSASANRRAKQRGNGISTASVRITRTQAAKQAEDSNSEEEGKENREYIHNVFTATKNV